MEHTNSSATVLAFPVKGFSFPGNFGQPNPEKIAIEMKLKHSVFNSLSMRDIKLLCKIAKKGKRKFHDKLMVAGEENENLYLLTKGSCLIRNGGKFFAEIDEGHFVGEISHFIYQPVSVDVVPRGDIEYLCWDRTGLNRLLSRRPGLKSRFYNVLILQLAARLQSATKKIVPQ